MNSIKPVEELTFTDDFMFTTIMKDKEICKELLERLLKIKVTEINYPVAQKSLAPFFETKGVRLDVYVDDGKRDFDIEIQTYIPEAPGKRMRYYQSILDMDSLQKGSVYTELKETYILFICTNDPFGRDLPVYTFKNRCIEDEEVSNDDKSTKVIYNATSYAKEKDSQIRAFLQYLCNRSSTDDFTNKIDKQVEHFKLSERFKGDYMFVKLHEWEMKEKAKKEGYEEGFESGREKGIQVGIQQGIEQGIRQGIEQGIERGIERGIQKGISEGAEQTKIETAKNAIKMGLSTQQIIELTGLSEENIKKLLEE